MIGVLKTPVVPILRVVMPSGRAASDPARAVRYCDSPIIWRIALTNTSTG
jgi:hypothetical protein